MLALAEQPNQPLTVKFHNELDKQDDLVAS